MDSLTLTGIDTAFDNVIENLLVELKTKMRIFTEIYWVNSMILKKIRSEEMEWLKGVDDGDSGDEYEGSEEGSDDGPEDDG